MVSPTECWTLSLSEWTGLDGLSLKDEGVCSLSDILETGDVPQRYYLSATACRGILRRAAKRGKDLPPMLFQALLAVAGALSDAWKPGGQDPVIAVCFGGNDTRGAIDVATTQSAHGSGRYDFESETFVAHALRGEGFDASEDGTGRGTPLVPICFSTKDYGNDSMSDVAPTLRSMNFDKSHANGGGQLGVAFDMRGRDGGAQFEGPHETANIRAASGGSSRSYVAQTWAVRRLTPRECERLQGFPDDFTAIPYRRKIAADGPRYKALGNSMAVNVMRWIGRRIETVEAIKQ